MARLPEQEDSVLVPHSVWKQFMNRLGKCTASTSSLESTAWACFGAAASFLASVVTFFFSIDFFQQSGEPKWPVIIAEIVLLVLTILFGLAWWGTWRLSISQKKYHADMVQIILEDMEMLGDKYAPSDKTKDIRDEVMANIPVGSATQN